MKKLTDAENKLLKKAQSKTSSYWIKDGKNIKWIYIGLIILLSVGNLWLTVPAYLDKKISFEAFRHELFHNILFVIFLIYVIYAEQIKAKAYSVICKLTDSDKTRL